MTSPLRQHVSIWTPFAFAMFLSINRVVFGDSGSGAFYSFLPMCFFFTAASQAALLSRVQELEAGQESESSSSVDP